MRLIWVHIFLLLCISCGEPKEKDRSLPDAGTAARRQYDDAKYVAKVYGSLTTQDELQHIALRRSRNERIKKLAQKLVHSYNELRHKIEQVAAVQKLVLDPALRFDQENHIEFLQKEPLNTFDVEYLNILVREHEMFVKDFARTGVNSDNAMVQSLAHEVLALMRANLTFIEHEQEVYAASE
jgi:predicted outer membrane protein